MATLSHVAVALGAMQIEQLGASRHGVGIILDWISAHGSLAGNFGELGIVKGVLPRRRESIFLRGGESKSHRQKNHRGTGQFENSCRHWRLPNKRPSIAPKPENSRDTPQRSKKRWLLSFRPKPGE